MKVWIVLDLREAPGACPTAHIASTQEKAQTWADRNPDELRYGYEVFEWEVDSD